MKILLKYSKKFFLKSILFISAIVLGMAFEYSWQPIQTYIASSNLSNKTVTTLNHSRLDNVWQLLNDEYIDPSALDSEKALFGAIRGMVSSIGDPYTSFFDPEEAKLFLSDTEGSFEGIGAEIGMRKGNIIVIAPIQGTPAQRAGLKAGDIILQIDEISTANLTLDQAVSKIRGPRNTPVKLLIIRDEGEPFIIEIVRDQITIPSLSWEMRDNNIAYLQLFNFSQRSDQEFEKAAKDILLQKPSGIILDLRNNPGGYLDRAVDIAGWFLPRETVVVMEETKDKSRTILRSEGNGWLKDIPLIILINEGSASASEILAGALSENLNIPLVGQKTFGKGSVQSLESISDGSAVKITVARWLTPNGISINNEGIKPTVEVTATETSENTQKDAQYEKAKEILLQRINNN